jgi:hypothetical protein
MAHFHIKTKKGRPYLYVREIARINGRPKVISQVYLGSPERLVQMARSSADSGELKLKAEEFGALWLASHPDRDIELVGLIDSIVPRHHSESGPTIGEYFLYCVWNRMVHPVSKNKLSAWYARTAIQQIRPIDIRELTSQRYWEKWDRVSEKHINHPARGGTNGFSSAYGRWKNRKRIACCLTPPTITPLWLQKPHHSLPYAEKTRQDGTICSRLGRDSRCPQESPAIVLPGLPGK